MRKTFISLIGLLLFGCGTKTLSNNKNISTVDYSEQDIVKKNASCMNGDGLECSRLGYYFKQKNDIKLSKTYTEKGCNLGDQSACMIFDNIIKNENKSNVWPKVKFYTDKLARCHNSGVSSYGTEMQLKENLYPVRIKFRVNKLGNAYNVKSDSKILKDSDSFNKCVLDFFSSEKFEPTPSDLISDFEFMLKISVMELR